LSAELTKKSF